MQVSATQMHTRAAAKCTQQPCAHGGGGSNENATGCVECTRDILEKEFKCSAVHNGNGQKLRQQTNVTGGVYVEPDVRVKKIIQPSREPVWQRNGFSQMISQW